MKRLVKQHFFRDIMILSRTKYIILALLACVPFLVWVYIVLPRLVVAVPENLQLSYEVLSTDNFYDPENQVFTGELPSKTLYSYDVIGSLDEVLSIENVFDVRTLSDDPIFRVQRVYGVNKYTGQHVEQFGDKNREGFLFAPRNLEAGQPFTYWHINYDAPAHMKYVETEQMQGIEVFEYHTTYENQVIDQTAQLTDLPGVPESRRVLLEPSLTLWVEPTTGVIVTYKDATTAYYYDRVTEEKLFPWNSFTNTFSEKTVKKNIEYIQSRKFLLLLQMQVIPLLLALIPLGMLLYGLIPASLKKVLTFFRMHLKWQQVLSSLLVIAGVVVVVGWIFNIQILKSFYPGLVTMKFSTAVSFIISGLILYFGVNSELRYGSAAKLLLPIPVLQISLLMGIQFIAALLGIETGIETLFVREAQTAILSTGPGVPSLGTMVGFLLIAAVGTLSIIHMDDKETIYKIIGFFLLLLSSVALAGYVLDIQALYYYFEGMSTAMSFHTALLFFLTSIIIFSSKEMDSTS